MKQCKNCSIELTNNSQKKFCSSSCAASFNNKGIRRHGRGPIDCLVCSTKHNNAKFCSPTCSGIFKKKYKTPEDKLAAVRALNRESFMRYYAKKTYQTPQGEDLAAIRIFYQNCPTGYEVDHIIPISKGGLHTLSNLQYLTVSENRSKSNKLNWRSRLDSNQE